MACAAVLTAIPWPATVFVVGVAAVHALWRRPGSPPALLVLGEDGAWYVAGHGVTRFTLGPHTRFAPFWVRLDLRAEGLRRPLGIVLLADQLDDATWRRLMARLRRAAAPPSPT